MEFHYYLLGFFFFKDKREEVRALKKRKEKKRTERKVIVEVEHEIRLLLESVYLYGGRINRKTQDVQ